MLALVCAAGGGHCKKLEEAARLWARGDLVHEAEVAKRDERALDHLQEQFDVLGIVPEESVDVSDGPVLPFYLFPECLPTWQLFMAVQTEWRGTSVAIGLDKPGVQILIDQRRAWRARRRRVFAEICLMERAVLEEWEERRKRQGTVK